MKLSPAWFLNIVFLVVLAGVPLSQVAVEACRGEWPQALAVFRQRPTAANLRAYERTLEEASWTAAAFRPWVQDAQFTWLHDGGAKALVGREGWLFYKPGVQYLTERPRTHEGIRTAREALTAITAFRDQLAARGIPLIVMPVPNKESIYPDRLTQRAAQLRIAQCDETRGLLDGLKAAGVEVVDLFALFAEAKVSAPASSPPLYLAQDSHWSPAGLELAARALAQRILARGWARPGAVAYAGRPAPVERVGDLLLMLQVPQIERRAVPEHVPCVQVLRQDTGQLYRDDPHAEILVLGDSFLRIYETDEPQSAGLIAHLARELQQPLTSLVNDGGASTLVRQELHRRPSVLAHKKLVIWEFAERDIRLGTEGWQHVPLPTTTDGTADRRPSAAWTNMAPDCSRRPRIGLVAIRRWSGGLRDFLQNRFAILPVSGYRNLKDDGKPTVVGGKFDQREPIAVP